MFALNSRMISVLMAEFPPNIVIHNDMESQAAIGLLQKECLTVYDQLCAKFDWFVTLDAVTAFATVCIAWEIGIARLSAERQSMYYIKQGSFNLAATELNKLKVNRRFTTILKLGRLS